MLLPSYYHYCHLITSIFSLEEIIYYVVVPLIVAAVVGLIVTYYFGRRSHKESENIDEVKMQESYYADAIGDIDIMLRNDDFLNANEPPSKVYGTIVRVGEKTVRFSNYFEEYLDFRNAWPEYGNPTIQQRKPFAEKAQTFRNKLVRHYNSKIIPKYNHFSIEKKAPKEENNRTIDIDPNNRSILKWSD